MGFRLNRTYVLDFSGTALDGLVVKMAATSVATAAEIRSTGEAPALADLIAANMVEWNYEDADGNPVPVEGAAIAAELEEAVLAAIAREWYKAAVGVTAPLDDASTSGEPSPEVSIPMEDL